MILPTSHIPAPATKTKQPRKILSFQSRILQGCLLQISIKTSFLTLIFTYSAALFTQLIAFKLLGYPMYGRH